MTVEIRWQKRKWGGAYFYPNEGTVEKVNSSEDWLRVLPTVSVSFNVEVWGLGHVQRVLVSQNLTPSIFLSFSDKPNKMSKDTTPFSILADQFLLPLTYFLCFLQKHFIFLSFFFFVGAHTHMHPDRYAHKGGRRSTHSSALSQLVKWLVRCHMCRTYGSLPIRWITLNPWAHSSADMIVLMDDDNIQTAERTRWLPVESCIFLWWREVCLLFFLAALISTPVHVCLCFLRVSRESSGLHLRSTITSVFVY